MYFPEKILVDRDVLELPFTQKILKKFPDVETQVVDDFNWICEESSDRFSLTKGKRMLHLKRFQGASIRLCPGYTDNDICCKYYVLDFIENCPLECSYCILQAFLNKPVMTLHVNVEEIIEGAVNFLKENPDHHFRVGTGEHSDSFALDSILEVNPLLVETFAKIPNATLELKTKTNAIDHILDLDHQGRTVLAWSLNPKEIVASQEFKTARLHERLEAAQKAIAAGYPVAFHFDPIIYYPGWKEGYKETVELMLKAVPQQSISWISMGTLRYIPALKQIAEERFPGLNIFSNEFIPGVDGKMKYMKEIREELIGWVAKNITEIAPEIPVYICMEKKSLWRKAMPYLPKDADELETVLTNDECRRSQRFNKLD